MTNFDIESRDVIALVVILCCFTLLFLGIDGEVKAFLGMVIGYYFGLYTKTPKKLSNG